MGNCPCKSLPVPALQGLEPLSAVRTMTSSWDKSVDQHTQHSGLGLHPCLQEQILAQTPQDEAKDEDRANTEGHEDLQSTKL